MTHSRVRTLVFVLGSTLALAGATAQVQAQSRQQAAQALASSDPHARRDAAIRLGDVGTMADVTPLLRSLHDADAPTRELAEHAIWEIWARSGNAEVDTLYRTGIEQMAAGDLKKSLADCDEVMKRNPNHFGTLSGYAQIYVRLERYERALDYSRRALAINPNLDGVRQIMELTEELLQQRRRQSI